MHKKNALTNVDDSVPVVAVFIDLAKEFDMSNSILLKQLSNVGIREITYQLIQSYKKIARSIGKRKVPI